MLAMDSSTLRLVSKHALSLTTIASMLAPTGVISITAIARAFTNGVS
jgi:hypothetical protein